LTPRERNNVLGAKFMKSWRHATLRLLPASRFRAGGASRDAYEMSYFASQEKEPGKAQGLHRPPRHSAVLCMRKAGAPGQGQEAHLPHLHSGSSNGQGATPGRRLSPPPGGNQVVLRLLRSSPRHSEDTQQGGAEIRTAHLALGYVQDRLMA